MKNQILNLWRQINRPGIENLIFFLETSDFFEVPASINHHLAKVGGLAEHSLNVYNALSEKCFRYPELLIPAESVIITALSHDFNKIHFFKPGGDPCSDAQFNYLSTLLSERKHLLGKDSIEKVLKLCTAEGLKRDVPAAHATILIGWLKNKPTEPMPDLPMSWSYNDQLPLGHGEKSVIMLQQYIKLELPEMLAIRWHMGPWDISETYGKWAYDAAVKLHPLVSLLHIADMEATHIIERKS
jgi:hypothetical protein